MRRYYRIPEISYSLLATSEEKRCDREFLVQLQKGGVDYLHYDISDKSTLKGRDVEKYGKFTRLPMDIHIYKENPMEEISEIRMEEKDFLCIHVENNLTIGEIKSIKADCPGKFGMAVNVETPLSELYKYGEFIDYVLIMAAMPGVSGGSFNESAIEKIQQVNQKYPNKKVHVDGGINNISAPILLGLGVDTIISGSYITKEINFEKQISKLVGINLGQNVEEVMYGVDQAPFVNVYENLQQVAIEIDTKGIGCTAVLENGYFRGLITDTDIRHAVMKRGSLEKLFAMDIMNAKPFIVKEGTNISTLLKQLQQNGGYFTVIPVLDDQDKYKGIIRVQDVLFTQNYSFRMRNVIQKS